ncbi:MAG: hydroxymethylbilane synthase [Ancalomicrobiaceae bacterium]|nr:hydroxymethylbilane synthase [Ancalomicrobiaceae bacterium]
MQSRLSQISSSRIWRIGTRGSPLALAQAQEVKDRLVAVTGWDAARFEICVIRTSGDRIQDRPLSEVGGKGLFTKEIEEAMLAGDVDFSVNSSKDMPTLLPDGLELSAFLPREDVRDAFISTRAKTFADLAAGAVVGTSSLRRQAMVRRLRPDLKVIDFRGNVETRLRKLADGLADATLLAYAGLKRLGKTAAVASLIATDDFLPAVGQGAIGLESRAADVETQALLALIHDPATGIALHCERAFLDVLDGSCKTPIAGLAEIDGDRLTFRGQILTPDGRISLSIAREGPVADAVTIGRQAGERLKAQAGPDFFATVGG